MNRGGAVAWGAALALFGAWQYYDYSTSTGDKYDIRTLSGRSTLDIWPLLICGFSTASVERHRSDGTSGGR
eukprot:12516807-Prorocentrum_lima.AAC.1